MKNYILPIAFVSLMVIGFLGVNAILVSPEPVPTPDYYSEDCCGASSEDDSSGGCGPGGGCGSGGSAEENELLARNYYIDQTGDSDIEVTVEDFGCHQEATILKNGQEVMKLSISGGEVSEV